MSIDREQMLRAQRESQGVSSDVVEAEIQQMRAASAQAAGADIRELIIAARIVAYEDQSAKAIRQLDRAVEKFAEAVAWDNEPEGDATVTIPAALDDAQIKHMVQRFLMWKLPETFNPDGGISFQKTYGEGTPWPGKHEPVGTNLLDGVQATAMVRHMVEGLPASPQPARETEAAQDVLAERHRQIEAEGWTPEHDDAHDKGEMLTAAWCYMQRHADKDMFGDSYDINKLPPPARWPWDWLWWKPKDRRRDLVKAGALILAEIERLDRAATILALMGQSGDGWQDIASAQPSTDTFIDQLTDGEGDTVAFCSPNPDFNGLPNECVVINASWTGWEDRYFRADTRKDCLNAAVKAMREAAIAAPPAKEGR